MTSNKDNVLAYLNRHAGSWVTASELVGAGGGWRYSARIHELRLEGYDIESRKGRGEWIFRLNVPGQMTWDAA